MTYATPEDVQTVLGRTLTPEETLLVSRRLSQVERQILRRVPDLAEKIEAEEIDPEDVIQVEADAVLRVVRNPEGLYSETDGNYGYQLSREAADSSLRITAEEWALLGIRPSMVQIVPRIVMPR